jgi:hypothetical protein
MCRFVLEDCVDLRAAVGFAICRTKGVVRRIAKSRHRFLLLGFGKRSVRLSLSLSLSVYVSLSHRVEKIFVSFLVQQVEISGENWN